MSSKFSVFAALFLIGLIYAVNAGFPNLNCPDPKNPRAKVLLDCNVDCQHQHGTEGGRCGNPFIGDFNCYCGRPTTIVYENSGQCMEVSPEIEQLCSNDCACNHAATGGFCDWNRKACMCHGYNMGESRCPYNNMEGFLNGLYQLMGPDRMAKFPQYAYNNGNFQGLVPRYVQ